MRRTGVDGPGGALQLVPRQAPPAAAGRRRTCVPRWAGRRAQVATVLAVAARSVALASSQNCSWTCPEPEEGPAPIPDNAIGLNGVRWPDLCIGDPKSPDGKHHFFTIGDWGGMGNPPRTFDNTVKKRKYISGPDTYAQQNVAKLMKRIAATSKPEYIINVGDNFYPAGVQSWCGSTDMCNMNAKSRGQWMNIFERMYDGPDLFDKVWMGVLGNHDWGGWQFNLGWDQTIAYTWHSTRWLTPALYWQRTVNYCDFTIDYFFLDTNNNDVFHPDHDPKHNICSSQHSQGANCEHCGGANGPWGCHEWFRRLWNEQIAWLEPRLNASRADWQIVVTHFTPQWDPRLWAAWAPRYGIDLFITGHRHQQEMHYMDHWVLNLGKTAWVVTGGGGGITSESIPYWEGPHVQQYGFLDVTISKEEMVIDMWSWTGKKWSSTKIEPVLAWWQTEAPTPAPTPGPPATNASDGSVTDVYAACAEHIACTHLSGDCCPDRTGQMLSCCDDARRLDPVWAAATPQEPFEVAAADEGVPLPRFLQQLETPAEAEPTSVPSSPPSSSASARRLPWETCEASRRRWVNGNGNSARRRGVWNWGKNCWDACGGPGYCDGFCNEGNACCRLDTGADPVECGGADFQGWRGFHVCVQPVDHFVDNGTGYVIYEDVWEGGDNIEYLNQTSFFMASDLSSEDCFEPCGNRSGYCTYHCGLGRACCKEGDPDTPEECKSPYGPFATDHYECITPSNETSSEEEEGGSSMNVGDGLWASLVFGLFLATFAAAIATAWYYCRPKAKKYKKKTNKRALSQVLPQEEAKAEERAPLVQGPTYYVASPAGLSAPPVVPVSSVTVVNPTPRAVYLPAAAPPRVTTVQPVQVAQTVQVLNAAPAVVSYAPYGAGAATPQPSSYTPCYTGPAAGNP